MKRFECQEGFYYLKDLPTGEYFKLSETASRVYIRGRYDRTENKYDCTSFDNCSYSRLFDGSRVVYAGFTF